MESDNDSILKLPKVELHNHLEGTINPETFHKLAKKNSDGRYSESLENCLSLYNFGDFQEFLLAFATVNQYIKDLSDIDIIIKDYFERIKKENYRYVEFFLSIDTFKKNEFHLPELLDRVRHSLNQYSNGIETGVNIDFVRNYGPKFTAKILNEIEIDKYRDLIFGISIGGDEEQYPAPPFKKLFEKARSMGLKTTCHSGEIMGPESIWETILHLKPDRIGHGINSILSHDLINHLKAIQTPLEVCPTSNLKTGAIPSPILNHPIRNLFNKGVNVTINTDDSGFFGNDLSSELLLCHNLFKFTLEEIKSIILEACKASFLPDQNQKYELLYKVTNELEFI